VEAAEVGKTRAMTWRRVRQAAVAVLCLQTAGLVALGTFLYRRFMESVDYGIFAQAFTLIGRGDLDPQNTLKQGSFLSSHFELIMWPISLLSWVTPGTIALVWIQALALGASGIVVALWASSLLEERGLRPSTGALALSGVVVMVAVNQVAWRTVAEDFHFEALAGLFILLAARQLYAGRRRSMWVLIGLCLLCGDVPALFVVGLGITGLLSRARRRTGAAIVLAGIVWLMLIGLVGANHASHLSDYSYLAETRLQPGLSGLVHLAMGLVTHPGHVASVLADRSDLLFANLRAGGIVGLVTPIGLGVPLIVLSSAGLESHLDYLRAGFQIVPAIPLMMVGTVMALVWVSLRPPKTLVPRRRPVGAWLAVVAALAIVTSSVMLSWSPGRWLLKGSANPHLISDRTAHQLDRTLAATPRDAQVIAQVQVVGRFSGRRSVEWAFFGAERRLRIVEPEVVVVVLRRPGTPQNPTMARLRRAGAEVIVNGGGVEAVRWHPSTGRRSVLVGP